MTDARRKARNKRKAQSKRPSKPRMIETRKSRAEQAKAKPRRVRPSKASLREEVASAVAAHAARGPKLVRNAARGTYSKPNTTQEQERRVRQALLAAGGR